MISFDAYRDILCFGMNDDGFEQITFLIEKPDRANEAAAKDNLLAHFPKLKRMEVTFVIQMFIKLKALDFALEPAYTIQKPTKSKARSASAIITESPPESSKKARIE
jgi:hypothetical protein